MSSNEITRRSRLRRRIRADSVDEIADQARSGELEPMIAWGEQGVGGVEGA
jgi:hypothetical protein